MTTAIETPQTFEDRMKARIKESIGDLITDEDLTKMVARSMEEVFFRERRIRRGYNDDVIPPLLNEIVQKELTEQVRSAVYAYIHEHGAEVEKIIKDVLQQGIGAALVTAVTHKFQGDMFLLQQNLTNSIQR